MVGEFPSATFGKPEGASAYQIIRQDKEFEAAEVAAAFQKIYTSFEWRPTPDEKIHPPCYAILPFDNAILIARYTDDGRDDTGRPHTLRIDCLLTRRENFDLAWSKLAPDQTPLRELPSTFEIIGDSRSYSTN